MYVWNYLVIGSMVLGKANVMFSYHFYCNLEFVVTFVGHFYLLLYFLVLCYRCRTNYLKNNVYTYIESNSELQAIVYKFNSNRKLRVAWLEKFVQ